MNKKASVARAMMAGKGADSRSFFAGVWVLPTSKNTQIRRKANRAFFGKVYAFPLLAAATVSRRYCFYFRFHF